MTTSRTRQVARSIRVRAFAKINLTLRVLGARPDRSHDLRTVFQSLALHDALTFRTTPGPLRIECDNPACPADRANLAWQAAERMWVAAGRRGAPRDLTIRIAKRIPMQGGLGGGSSDAAATIRALAALWHAELPRARELEIAAALGADVPFFLYGGTALGVERGDVLFPLMDVPVARVTLVMPGFGVSTADAYGWWDDREAGALRHGRRRSVHGAAPIGSLPAGDLRNDLQGPVSEHHPEISRLITSLCRHGASYAAMSGSGSSVFGLFESSAAAACAAAALGTGRWRTLVTRTLGRAAYGRLARPRLG